MLSRRPVDVAFAHTALGSGYRNDPVCAYDGTGLVREIDVKSGVISSSE